MNLAQTRSAAEPGHLDPQLNHLAMPDEAQPLFNAVKKQAVSRTGSRRRAASSTCSCVRT